MFLRTAFTRNAVPSGYPLTYNVDYENVGSNNLLVVESRKQLSNGSYPVNPDSRWSLFLGAVPKLSASLVTVSPQYPGTYVYRTSLVDERTGNITAFDSISLNVSSTATARTEADSIDFFMNPSLGEGQNIALRVTYLGSIFSNVLLEWNVYKVIGGQQADFPVATYRFDMGNWYAGDIQMVIPVAQSQGDYIWQWRVIDNSRQVELSTKSRLVHVTMQPTIPQSQSPPNPPNVVTPLPSSPGSAPIMVAPSISPQKQSLNIDTIIVGLALVSVAALVIIIIGGKN